MSRQTTIARPVTLAGHGLHTGRRACVTLRPAPAGSGRRIARLDGGRSTPTEMTSVEMTSVEMTWAHWTPSRMSTSIDLGDGRAVRTVEHMLSAMHAHGLDNVLVEIEGGEVPIFDGSARAWVEALGEAGIAPLDAPRRAIRIREPHQVSAAGGFLRAEPAEGFSIDVTYACLLGLPVMRWSGTVEPQRYDEEVAPSRSFGDLGNLLGREPVSRPRPDAAYAAVPNRRDAELPPGGAQWDKIQAREAASPSAPLLRGWRPWRAVLVVGRHILPSARFPDEPVRHVALDMIGDLALAGLPLIGRIVAHDPSHVKTYAFVAALMRNPSKWEIVEG